MSMVYTFWLLTLSKYILDHHVMWNVNWWITTAITRIPLPLPTLDGSFHKLLTTVIAMYESYSYRSVHSIR